MYFKSQLARKLAFGFMMPDTVPFARLVFASAKRAVRYFIRSKQYKLLVKFIRHWKP